MQRPLETRERAAISAGRREETGRFVWTRECRGMATTGALERNRQAVRRCDADTVQVGGVVSRGGAPHGRCRGFVSG